MDTGLAASFDTLVEMLSIDIKAARRVSADHLKKFKDYFALEYDPEGHLFFNDFNLVVTSRPVFDELSSFIKTAAVTTLVESREHNLFMAVYPYFNDTLIRQIFEG